MLINTHNGIYFEGYGEREYLIKKLALPRYQNIDYTPAHFRYYGID
jgi:hypothetical protein